MHRTAILYAASLAALTIATPALAACEDLAQMPLDGGRVTSGSARR